MERQLDRLPGNVNRRVLASGEDEVIPFDQAVREIREGKVLHD